MWDLPANSASNQSRILGPWHSGQAFSALRYIVYSQSRLTVWDQKFQIFLMNASLRNYLVPVSLQDKIEHRSISLSTVVHSQLLSGMVDLWLWAPVRLHWVGKAVLCAKKAEIPGSISAEYHSAVTRSFAQPDTALNCIIRDAGFWNASWTAVSFPFLLTVKLKLLTYFVYAPMLAKTTPK